MKEKRALENDFKCPMCKQPLARVSAEKRARYKIGHHWGCTNIRCRNNFDEVFYRTRVLKVTPKNFL